ncbi:MAG: hypothetical protein OXB93_05180 [Cytophagales bacterium]|nr:hypothetical protein [Cytophagales bacterium]
MNGKMRIVGIVLCLVLGTVSLQWQTALSITNFTPKTDILGRRSPTQVRDLRPSQF